MPQLLHLRTLHPNELQPVLHAELAPLRRRLHLLKTTLPSLPRLLAPQRPSPSL